MSINLSILHQPMHIISGSILTRIHYQPSCYCHCGHWHNSEQISLGQREDGIAERYWLGCWCWHSKSSASASATMSLPVPLLLQPIAFAVVSIDAANNDDYADVATAKRGCWSCWVDGYGQAIAANRQPVTTMPILFTHTATPTCS